MNSASGGLRPTVGLRRPGKSFASAEADAWRAAPEEADCNRRRAYGRWSAWVPNEFGLRRPAADGRPAPTGKGSCVGGADAWRAAPGRADFQSAQKPSADGRPAPTGKILRVGAGRRLARQRLKRPIAIGAEPSADGRPACRMNSASGGLRPMVGLRRPGRGLASAEADAWRAAPGKADFNRRRAFGRRSACADRENPSRRRGRRLARQRLERPISIGAEPSADGRPAPTEKTLRVGGGRRLARSAWEADFQSAQKPSADGRPAPTEKHPSCALKDGSSQLNSGRAEANA
jgi:hypothetical protein